MRVINNSDSNNIYFGLNQRNKDVLRAYSKAYTPIKEKRTLVLSRLDMEDSDKTNIAKFLNWLMTDAKTPPSDITIAIKKSAEESNHILFTQGYNSLLARWDKLFLTARESLGCLFDKMGVLHPEIGGLSRSTVGPQKEIVIKNISLADDYIKENVVTDKCPDKDFLIKLNSIITKDIILNIDGKELPSADYSGIVIGSSLDMRALVDRQGRNVEYSLDKVCNFLQNNYATQDIFHVCAKVYAKLLNIAPFYDGNGRTSRAFIDAILQSKGYKIDFPSNFAEIGRYPIPEITEIIKNNSVKI